MGVLVHDDAFATFDLLKDLEKARNCLHVKKMNKPVNVASVEIVEFNPE